MPKYWTPLPLLSTFTTRSKVRYEPSVKTTVTRMLAGPSGRTVESQFVPPLLMYIESQPVNEICVFPSCGICCLMRVWLAYELYHQRIQSVSPGLEPCAYS